MAGHILFPSVIVVSRSRPVTFALNHRCRSIVPLAISLLSLRNLKIPVQSNQAEGYGGPPPSPVVAQSWDRGYVSGLDESYMRQQDPQGILPTTGTPLASGTSGSGETQFLVSGG